MIETADKMMCRVPRCTEKGAIVLRGRQLCDDHWSELCGEEDAKGDLAAQSLLMRWRFPSRKEVRDALAR